MRIVGWKTMVGGCSLVALVACSGKDEPSKAPPVETKPAQGAEAKPAPEPIPTPPAGAPLPAPPEGMLWISGTVNDAPGGSPSPGAAEVCLHTPKTDRPCVQTDSSGTYSIAVPKNEQVVLLFRGRKQIPTLRAFVTGTENWKIGNTRVSNEIGLKTIAKSLGVEERPDRGVVFFSGKPGTTATLEPASGTRFYMSYGSNLDKTATAVPMRGSAGFLNVEPGQVAIRFAHADGPCAFRSENTMSGWPDPKDPGIAIVPVLAGHHTHMTTMFCGTPGVRSKKPGATR